MLSVFFLMKSSICLNLPSAINVSRRQNEQCGLWFRKTSKFCLSLKCVDCFRTCLSSGYFCNLAVDLKMYD